MWGCPEVPCFRVWAFNLSGFDVQGLVASGTVRCGSRIQRPDGSAHDLTSGIRASASEGKSPTCCVTGITMSTPSVVKPRA